MIAVTDNDTVTVTGTDRGTSTVTPPVTVLPTAWSLTGVDVTLPGGLEAGGSGGRRDPESPVYPRPCPGPCPCP